MSSSNQELSEQQARSQLHQQIYSQNDSPTSCRQCLADQCAALILLENISEDVKICLYLLCLITNYAHPKTAIGLKGGVDGGVLTSILVIKLPPYRLVASCFIKLPKLKMKSAHALVKKNPQSKKTLKLPREHILPHLRTISRERMSLMHAKGRSIRPQKRYH